VTNEKLVRERLEELRADLQRRSVRNPSSSRSSSGRRNAGADLQDVERALAMLDKGTYGICERCGQPISADRLDAYPASRFCLEDQQKLDR
jgi:RNA polymerase-binding transcription factor DksA